jgi:hypothetical protein
VPQPFKVPVPHDGPFATQKWPAVHTSSLLQLWSDAEEFATQPSIVPGQWRIQMPLPHDPQGLPSVAHVGSVVELAEVDVGVTGHDRRPSG